MGVAVSVIVPVYNTGPYIEQCIDSLVRQSLPKDQYEVIFVNDGSTDDTPARLEQLAADEPNVTVLHEPGSGWSGRPRNVGIDHSSGRYVFFCDHDDWLGLEALERMVAYADKTSADLLIGKMVGHGRNVPRFLFLQNDPKATLWSRPLTSSLTPHKLFRRSFLDSRNIRFPEGKRRLEDHVVVMKAYFEADTIAVLADYPCYHHIRREENDNAGFTPIDPPSYFGYVREVIDIIDEHTEPGPDRNAVLDRPYSTEMLGRVSRSRAFVERSLEHRRSLFHEVRTLMLERFPPDFGKRLGPIATTRAALVQADQPEVLDDLNARVGQVRGQATVTGLMWDTDHWRLEIECQPVFEDGTPVRVLPAGDELWSMDPRLLPPEVLEDFRVPTKRLVTGRTSISVVDRASMVEWFATTQTSVELREIPGDDGPARSVMVHAAADLDPATLAFGTPLNDGMWFIRFQMGFIGVQLTVRAGTRGLPGLTLPGAAIVGQRPATIIPYLAANTHQLIIDVGQRHRHLIGEIVQRPMGPVSVKADSFEVPVAVCIAPGAQPRGLSLAFRAGGAVLGEGRAVIVATDNGAVLRGSSRLRAHDGKGAALAGPATYQVAARSRARDELEPLGLVTVDAHGRVTGGDFTVESRSQMPPQPSAYRGLSMAAIKMRVGKLLEVARRTAGDLKRRYRP